MVFPLKHQSPDQVVDVTDWILDNSYDGIYPEGSREKIKILSNPYNVPFDFLLPKHGYLYKHSVKRHPDQFWIEVIAYRLGCLMKVPVPPAFVAVNHKNSVTNAALIEWFYNSADDSVFTDGGDLFRKKIPEYDLKKGTQHNFESIFDIFSEFEREGLLDPTWKESWIKILLFDSVIGNTDRHQNNWGIIASVRILLKKIKLEIAPAFDNGTSMGYEILEENFHKFENPFYIEHYADQGTHHMTWSLQENKNRRGCGHFEMIEKLLQKFPDIKDLVGKMLNFSLENFQKELNELTLFQVKTPFTAAKAVFIHRLVKYRRDRLLTIIKL